MSKKKNNKTKTKKKGTVLYWIAGIVIVIPLVLLLWIYLGAKENSGKPTVGNRFDKSLNPAISEQDVNKLKSALKFKGTDNIEVNLISATLRINIDTADNASKATIKSIMNKAYDEVNDVLPIKKYFTNNDSEKMYDLEVHVYNYIPDEKHSDDGWIYMIKTKTAAAKKANVSTPSSPKNKSVADKLMKQQKEAEKAAKKAEEGK